MEKKSMTLVRLSVENVKRIKAAQITPEGSTVIVGGENGEGKTSLLDAIAYCLDGKKAQCDEPVRRGAKTATIVCDLGDIVVTRVITKKGGGTLVVENKKGARFPSPQAVLDGLYSRLTFDPLLFAGMKPGEQQRTLRELVGLDFTELDGARSDLYNERTEANRAAKSLKARIDATPAHLDAPDELIVIADLMAELEKRQSQEKEAEAVKEAWREAERIVGASRRLVMECEEAVAAAERMLAAAQEAAQRAEEDWKAASAPVDKLQAEPPPPSSDIWEQIAAAEATNEKVRQNAGRRAAVAEHHAASDHVLKLTNDIYRIDAEKAEALAKAPFPIPGLSFDDAGVLFNDLPFDQASSAEQLRVSVAIGFALNPKLKLLLIRDGSLLDTANLALVGEMAEAADGQVWIECVGKGDKCQVIIEDGQVKAEEADDDTG